MSTIHLEALFSPGSVTVVGPASEPGSVGSVVLENLRRSEFAGTVTVIDPARGVADLETTPDLAVLAAPPEEAAELVSGLGARGTRAVIVAGHGFARLGPRSREVGQAMLDAARPHKVRVVGPASLGVITPELGLNASAAHLMPRSGGLAFLSQSGAIVNSVLDWAAPRQIGFSHLLSVGDMIDVDFGDLLDHLATDPGTSAILLYVERIKHARKFLSAARIAARMKPVVVVKAGRHRASERESPHGPVSGADEVHEAAFRRTGLLRAATLEGMFTAVTALAQMRPPAGPRLAIVTNAGALGVLATDRLLGWNGSLAPLTDETLTRLDAALAPECPAWSRTNPIDLGGDAGPARYAAAVEALRDAREVDGVIMIHGPSAFASAEDTARAVIEAGRGMRGKRLLASWVGAASYASTQRLFAEAKIPSFDTPGEAVGAFVALVEYKKRQALLMETPPSIQTDLAPRPEEARAAIAGAIGDGRSELATAEVEALLGAYGLTDGRDASSAPTGPQLFIGVSQDPVFGVVLHFGLGGAARERVDDRAVGLPPLNLPLAHDLIAQTRIHEVLRTSDETPGPVLEALALALLRVCQMVLDHPEIVELEADPITVDADGAVLHTTRVRVAPAPENPRERLAIHPYPKELEETITRGDRSFFLRPLLPEDEPMLRARFETLTPEEIRLRFFSAPKHLSHQLAARLTQLDFDREMALVLTEPGAPGTTELHGVVRLHCDANNDRGEFAIIVHHDLAGQGLGRLLMERIIQYGRDRGLRIVYGDVLGENHAMRGLSRALGFREERSPDDAGVVRVVLDL